MHNMTTVYWCESIKNQIVVKYFNITRSVTTSAYWLCFVSFQQKTIWIMGCPLMTLQRFISDKFWIPSFGVCKLEDRPSVDVLSSFLCNILVLCLETCLRYVWHSGTQFSLSNFHHKEYFYDCRQSHCSHPIDISPPYRKAVFRFIKTQKKMQHVLYTGLFYTSISNASCYIVLRDMFRLLWTIELRGCEFYFSVLHGSRMRRWFRVFLVV
jgi:hypothetical protein